MRCFPALVITIACLVNAAHGAEVMGVITEVDGPAEIVGDNGKRNVSPLSVIRGDEKLVVQPGAEAMVRFNGRSYTVTGEDSPFTLPEKEAGATVASNLLDWATGILTGDDKGLAQSVSAVSRGGKQQAVPLLGPMWNRVKRRDQLYLPHEESVAFTGAWLESGGQSREVPISGIAEGISRLTMDAIPPGEYGLEVCTPESCQSGMLDWRESIGMPPEAAGEPVAGEDPALHQALVLMRHGGAEYGLEAFQRLHALRSQSEMARLLHERLRQPHGNRASP